MSSESTDTAQVRAAVRDLMSAVDRLRRSHPDSIDLRRLAEDVARVGTDVDMLLGPATHPAPPVAVEIIPDHEYDPQLFADADDEGVGPRRQ